MSKAPSIRRQLLLLVGGLVLLVWCMMALRTYQDALHEVDELFDAQLAQSARLLLEQAAHELPGERGELSSSELFFEEGVGHPYERKLFFQIWNGHGELLYHSSALPASLPLSAVSSGFSDTTQGHHVWRVFSVWDREHALQIQIGQRYEVRQELAAAIAVHTLMPLILALPLLGLLIFYGVDRGLRPLARVTAEISRRAPSNLTPLEATDVPREIHPLVLALNRLFERLAQALELERRFTADAAHELRTPLAAVRTQAQVAQRASSPAEQQRALEQVLQGVDRTAHLVQQLLLMARLDPVAPSGTLTSFDLRELAQEVLVELAQRSVSRGLELSLNEGEPARIEGQRDLLRILIRNLVDNAIRYTPSGGAVEVSVSLTPRGVSLEVVDNGPGIPPEERKRVFDRFYRILGSGEGGSGLGLSIVKRIAELHQAEVVLRSGVEDRGLKVGVFFESAPERPGLP